MRANGRGRDIYFSDELWDDFRAAARHAKIPVAKIVQTMAREFIRAPEKIIKLIEEEGG